MGNAFNQEYFQFAQITVLQIINTALLLSIIFLFMKILRKLKG